MHFCRIVSTFVNIVRVSPVCSLCPAKPSFSNYPALSPSLPGRKLFHLCFFINTTPFYWLSYGSASGAVLLCFALALCLFFDIPSNKKYIHLKPILFPALPSIFCISSHAPVPLLLAPALTALWILDRNNSSAFRAIIFFLFAVPKILLFPLLVPIDCFLS